MTRTMLIALAALSLGSAALAQPAPPAAPQRAEGTIAAMTDTSLTLTQADGAAQTIALLPGRTVNVVAPIAVDQIQPGSYVATANKTQPDGSGVSTELRVYPPGTPRFNVNAAMDATGETMMTNGTVATAVASEGGRVLTVDYGSGSRKITVPPQVQVVSNTPGGPELLRVGLKVSVVTFAASAERPALQIFTIAPG